MTKSCRALHRIHGATELHKYAIPHQLDDAPAMLGKKGTKDLSSPGLERLERAGLIPLHRNEVWFTSSTLSV